MMRQFCFAACLVVVAGTTAARGELYSQIPEPFTPHVYTVISPTATVNLSQFDLGATAPNLQNFATVYDDFTLSTTGQWLTLNWVGRYEGGTTPFAPSFDVSLYTDVTPTLGSGTLVSSFNVASANETVNPDDGNFFDYTADVTSQGIVLNAGTRYWLSVVARLDYGDDGWGWAFSSQGNQESFQDFGDTSLTRFDDAVDYAFSVSVVPEPGSMIGLLGVVALASLRRRPRR